MLPAGGEEDKMDAAEEKKTLHMLAARGLRCSVPAGEKEERTPC